MKVTRERFQQLVQEALVQLPKRFARQIKNVAILVEDFPPPGQNLLGLYHGVPLNRRGSYYGNVPPDVIVLYQMPIESLCWDEEQLKEKIEEVLLHEIGHYFGMDEITLREIEAYRMTRRKSLKLKSKNNVS
ncbi:MAG: metallopeptidase family protein [Candidatus Aminicenantes bacterium]|jgi:predicted Zn-dependent protease with MMP-like domain|nr:metallopeptidase family protein [Candidatus Aminicenantes bacterium]